MPPLGDREREQQAVEIADRVSSFSGEPSISALARFE
jgi:hypothetical protein